MTVTALIIVIRFQRRLRDYMQDRQALLKLIVFKLFVLITTVQNVSMLAEGVDTN